MGPFQILLVEDDSILALALSKRLQRYSNVVRASNQADAMKILAGKTVPRIGLAIIDLNLGHDDLEGLEIVRICRQLNIESVVLTGQDDKNTIRQCYQAGCQQYFTKFDFEERMDQLLGPIMQQLFAADDEFLQKFISKNKELRQKLLLARNAMRANGQRLLVTGPTGVGKSMLARLIHESITPGKPFIHVNLSELPENLIESELFGHVKGSFTGAVSDKEGLLSRADGGTLFLDEIGCISLGMQQKLLRVLEDKTFSKVGQYAPQKVEFKLITATCDDLPRLVQDQKFRLDFYFRIRGLEIDIPGLAGRREDIFALIDHEINLSSLKIAFTPAAEKLLYDYNWHGNGREVKHLVQQLTFQGKGFIDGSDLPHYLRQNTNPLLVTSKKLADEDLLTQKMLDYVATHGLNALTQQIQKVFIKKTLDDCHGKINEATRRLGISKTLFYKFQSDTLQPDVQ